MFIWTAFDTYVDLSYPLGPGSDGIVADQVFTARVIAHGSC